jgi:transposase, IS5 family
MRPRFSIFRHQLEVQALAAAILMTVNRYLDARGIRITPCTFVNGTIIHAPSSTKISSGERDVEMHPTRKGKQWYYDAKAHIGMNSKEKVVHSVATSATREADVHMLSDPTARGGEEAVGETGPIKGRQK